MSRCASVPAVCRLLEGQCSREMSGKAFREEGKGENARSRDTVEEKKERPRGGAREGRGKSAEWKRRGRAEEEKTTLPAKVLACRIFCTAT
eukprot:2158578-Rhodomonas_salina.1